MTNEELLELVDELEDEILELNKRINELENKYETDRYDDTRY